MKNSNTTVLSGFIARLVRHTLLNQEVRQRVVGALADAADVVLAVARVDATRRVHKLANRSAELHELRMLTC